MANTANNTQNKGFENIKGVKSNVVNVMKQPESECFYKTSKTLGMTNRTYYKVNTFWKDRHLHL